MLVQVGDGEGLAAVRTLCALVVVDLMTSVTACMTATAYLADVARQVGHRKLLVTVGTGLLDLNRKDFMKYFI